MDEKKTTSDEKAEEDFLRRVDVIRSKINIGRHGHWGDWLKEDEINIMTGRSVLHEEIGRYGPWEGAYYSFDEQTRDRLIAHGRQDTAVAMVMARSALREAYHVRKLGERSMIMLAVALLLNAAVLASVWL